MKLNKSFTLVEILIVVCIFAIIAGSLGMTLFSALKLWQRAQAAGFIQTNILLSFESFSHNLRQAVLFPEFDFLGKKDKVEFMTIINDEIYKIEYKFSVSDLFSSKKTKYQDLIEEKDNQYSENELFKADSLVLSYLVFDDKELEYQWRDSFEQEGKVPLAVKIAVEEGERSFEKIVFVPIHKNQL